MDNQKQIAIEKIVNDDVESATFQALNEIHAERLFTKENMIILLKPNVLDNKPPERASVTHPAVLRSVIRWVKQFNPAKIYVADSCNGFTPGQTKRNLKPTGLQAVCDEEGAEGLGFEERPREIYKVPNPLVLDEIVSADLLKQADLIINLPKIKTHGYCKITCSIKNMFGTIIIGNKSKMHAKYPSVDKFSAALADIYSVSKPQLTVVDGYYCQEGPKGPAAGDVVKLDLIMAGYDPVAIDTAVCEIIGQDPKKVLHLMTSQEKGLGTMDLTQIEFLGNTPADVKHPFKLAGSFSMKIPVPRFITEYMSRILIKPDIKFDPNKCTLCQTCIHNCPFGAIAPPAMIKKGNVPIWTKKKCQACYCCVETCPAEAVNFKINIPKNVITSWMGIACIAAIVMIVLLIIFL